jgi:protein SCO1/2
VRASGHRDRLRGSGVGRGTVVLAIASAALVGIVTGLTVHRLASGTSTPRHLSGYRGQAIWPAGARPAPDFALPDQSGRRIELGSLRGRSVVLAFMDSRCHEQCPLEGRALAAGLRRVPAAERPVLLVVSVDPWADTPRSARAAMRHWGLAGSRWHWLLASRARLARVWNAYRIEVRRARGDILHTDAIYLIDRRGFERAGIVYPFLPTWIADDLRAMAG